VLVVLAVVAHSQEDFGLGGEALWAVHFCASQSPSRPDPTSSTAKMCLHLA
jgi:hypothetical protein